MIGKLLKELRKEKDVTQKDVADYLGVVRGSYAHYEIERRQPDYDTLIKIANYFNVSVDYLIGRTRIKEYGSLTNLQEFATLDEKRLLREFRSLSAANKKVVVALIKQLIEAEREAEASEDPTQPKRA